MNRFFSFFAILLFVSAASAFGQLTVTLHGDPDAKIDAGDLMEYTVSVKNSSSESKAFYVVRSQNELPSADWGSSICMGGLCYASEVSQPPEDQVGPGEEYEVRFTIYVGNTLGSTGKFTLDFYSFGLGGSKFASLEMNVTAVDESASVPVAVSGSILPYPNPTNAFLSIPLNGTRAESIEIFTTSGQQVGTIDDLAGSGDLYTLDTRDLLPGMYQYRIKGSDKVYVGTFHVIR